MAVAPAWTHLLERSIRRRPWARILAIGRVEIRFVTAASQQTCDRHKLRSK